MQSVEENQTEAQPKTEEVKTPDQILTGKLTFYLRNNVTYENHILLNSSQLDEFRESIVTGLEKPDSVFKLIGSNNNKNDFTIMQVRDITMVQYNIMPDKKETDDLMKQTLKDILEVK